MEDAQVGDQEVQATTARNKDARTAMTIQIDRRTEGWSLNRAVYCLTAGGLGLHTSTDTSA